ncbi:hypothetical protein [Vibrio sp. A1-1]|uniref:hypothetical protein n=1 Tax=Vibrio sp. A1-1 TaxID=2912250 RepID=UPI001F341DA6|nr:hypothetical protein [Vibrio sp. A1-1]MCF7456231.1 hypothetical protein [Vibrio sp. A1-1]
MLFSSISKVVTFINQIVLLPLALVSIGSDGFATFNIVLASVSWLFVFNGGLSPAIVKIFSSLAEKDEKAKSFQLSFLVLTGIIFLFGFVLSLVIQLSPQGSFVYNNANLIITVSCLSALNVLLSLATAIRQGLHQQYINNAVGLLGNVINLILVLCFYFFERTSLVELSISMLGGFIISSLIFLPDLLLKTKYLFNKVELRDLPFIKSFIITSSLFFIIQAAVYINQQITLILAANFIGNDAVTSFSFIFKYFMIVGGFVTMVFQPIWPAIHNAIAKKNVEWVLSVSQKLTLYLLCYGVFTCVIMFVFGEKIFSIWTNGIIALSPMAIYLVGFYFVLICYTQSNVIILMGLGGINKIAYITIIESLMVVVFLLLLLPSWGLEGGMIALTIPKLLISCVLLERSKVISITRISEKGKV